MKKILSAALIFVLVFAFSACGADMNGSSKPQSGGSDTLTSSGSSESQVSSQSEDSTALLSEAEAKKIALDHAGFAESDVYDLDIELDRDRGEISYEIDFEASGVEYEYDVHAKTGEILLATKEGEDISDTADTAVYKTKEEAKKTAFDHAGVSESDVQRLKVELERDDGVPSYEIEFSAGGYEYDYDIHAETGEILRSEKEKE